MKTPKTTLRWIVLLVVIIHIVYSNVYDLLTASGNTIQSITYLYPSLFTPSGFTFAIWGVIYVAFLCYAIYQLTPAGLRNPLCDWIAPLMIAANVLSCLWIAAFSDDDISLSIIIIVANLIIAGRLFTYTTQADKPWLRVPFSIYFAWLTVAAMANVSTWLVSLGWQGNYISEPALTILMLLLGFFIAITISYKYNSRVYACVVAWSTFGIWYANRETYIHIAYTAIIISAVLITWSVYLWAGRPHKVPERTPDVS